MLWFGEKERKIKQFCPKIKQNRLGTKNIRNNNVCNRKSTVEIWHKFYGLWKKKGKSSHSAQKSNTIGWAQKTSEITMFAIGSQQWKSGINIMVWRKRKENTAILAPQNWLGPRICPGIAGLNTFAAQASIQASQDRPGQPLRARRFSVWLIDLGNPPTRPQIDKKIDLWMKTRSPSLP